MATKELTYLDLLGLEDQSPYRLMERVQQGLPFSAFENLQSATKLSAAQLGQSIVLKPSSRARNKQKGQLTADQSERLVRLAHLLKAALELFEGDRDATLRWMETPRAALDGKTPFQMATSEIGAREVEKLIMRLEYGVFG